MARIPSTRSTAFWLAGLVLAAGLLLPALPAAAQTITVTSAVPDITDQGTVDLVVTIGGDGFAKGAKATFYVTGTTNPGGITVKSTKYKNPKTLEATIDVAPDAQTELKFDIQVQSGSRTGKGTELFSVRVKETGGDPIPPGSVLDLQATSITFNTASLLWTATADDGYDPASGPAAHYALYVRKGYDAATPDCGPFTVDFNPAATDPCGTPGVNGTPSQPGATDSWTVHYLAPSTQYWAMVRTLDDAPPAGQWSALADDLAHQISMTTAPFPPTPWIAESVDPDSAGSDVGVPQLDFDPAGNPTLFYVLNGGVGRLATWTGSGWLFEPVGAAFAPDPGYASDLGFDPASGQATIATLVPAGSKKSLKFYRRAGATADPWAAETVTTGNLEGSALLRFNPSDSHATIAYMVLKGAGGVLRLAERNGASWTNQDVAATHARYGLAFDAAGDPALTFVQWESDVARLRFAVRQGASWTLETADSGPGVPFTYLPYNSLAFDPARGDLAAASVFTEPPGGYNHALLRYCERTAGAWACTTLAETQNYFGGLSLAFGSDGTAYIAYRTLDTTLFVAVRPPGGAWTHEVVDWNVGVTDVDLAVGPDGQPGVAYIGNNNAATSLPEPPDPVRFARRSPWP